MTWGEEAHAAEEGDLLVVLAGRLDDAAELASELGLDSSSPYERIVATAYRRWADETPSRLRGAYSLLIWDRSRQAGLIAVDHLGGGGLVFTQGPTLSFAAEPRELLLLLQMTPAPEERNVVRHLVTGSLERDETLHAGVERLPGGHLLRLRDGRVTRERYWAAAYRTPVASSRAEAAHEVRHALERAVARPLAAGPSGVLLSGGLDSAAVAGIARATRPGLATYSAIFPGHPVADESESIELRTSLLRLSATRLAFDSGGALAATLRYLDRWRTPPASPTLFFHDPLLKRARADGVEILLDGQGGDELFGAPVYLTADLLRRGRVMDARRLTRFLLTPEARRSRRSTARLLSRYGLRGALPASLHALRRRLVPPEPPGWLTSVGVAAWTAAAPWQWKLRSGPRWWAAQVDATVEARDRAGVGDFLRRMAAAQRVQGAHPLLHDVDLLETVLALPPEAAFDPVLDRPVLREALTGIVPDAIRLQTRKAYFDSVFTHAVRADFPALRLLLGEDAAVRRYVRADSLERMLATDDVTSLAESWILWRLGVTEAWLRMQGDASFARDALERLPLEEAAVQAV